MPLTMLSPRDATGSKMGNGLIFVQITTQKERHTVIGHMVNVTAELRGLVRCLNSRLDLVSRLEKVS